MADVQIGYLVFSYNLYDSIRRIQSEDLFRIFVFQEEDFLPGPIMFSLDSTS